MLQEQHPLLLSALLGTLFTYALTAAGSALVFVCRQAYRKMLDSSLGFAAGVMTAASYWSLIAPAIEMADNSGRYGDWAFVPVATGFALGAAFVFLADFSLRRIEQAYDNILLNETGAAKRMDGVQGEMNDNDACNDHEIKIAEQSKEAVSTRDPSLTESGLLLSNKIYRHKSWHRILLLVIAITVHNIPEGLAVGVAFGAVGQSETATFASARTLALGIGIQNFPEGLAVSLPLRGLGMPAWKAFMWGQFSGMVEPVAGLLGCWAVTITTPILPYALAFAAGAMIWVVMDDIMPEAHSCGNGELASVGSIVGFLVMMSLDVALG